MGNDNTKDKRNPEGQQEQQQQSQQAQHYDFIKENSYRYDNKSPRIDAKKSPLQEISVYSPRLENINYSKSALTSANNPQLNSSNDDIQDKEKNKGNPIIAYIQENKIKMDRKKTKGNAYYKKLNKTIDFVSDVLQSSHIEHSIKLTNANLTFSPNVNFVYYPTQDPRTISYQQSSALHNSINAANSLETNTLGHINFNDLDLFKEAGHKTSLASAMSFGTQITSSYRFGLQGLMKPEIQDIDKYNVGKSGVDANGIDGSPNFTNPSPSNVKTDPNIYSQRVCNPFCVDNNYVENQPEITNTNLKSFISNKIQAIVNSSDKGLINQDLNTKEKPNLTKKEHHLQTIAEIAEPRHMQSPALKTTEKANIVNQQSSLLSNDYAHQLGYYYENDLSANDYHSQGYSYSNQKLNQLENLDQKKYYSTDNDNNNDNNLHSEQEAKRPKSPQSNTKPNFNQFESCKSSGYMTKNPNGTIELKSQNTSFNKCNKSELAKMNKPQNNPKIPIISRDLTKMPAEKSAYSPIKTSKGRGANLFKPQKREKTPENKYNSNKYTSTQNTEANSVAKQDNKYQLKSYNPQKNLSKSPLARDNSLKTFQRPCYQQKLESEPVIQDKIIPWTTKNTTSSNRTFQFPEKITYRSPLVTKPTLTPSMTNRPALTPRKSLTKSPNAREEKKEDFQKEIDTQLEYRPDEVEKINNAIPKTNADDDLSYRSVHNNEEDVVDSNKNLPYEQNMQPGQVENHEAFDTQPAILQVDLTKFLKKKKTQIIPTTTTSNGGASQDDSSQQLQQQGYFSNQPSQYRFGEYDNQSNHNPDSESGNLFASQKLEIEPAIINYQSNFETPSHTARKEKGIPKSEEYSYGPWVRESPRDLPFKSKALQMVQSKIRNMTPTKSNYSASIDSDPAELNN